ncbi:MAG TPA: hypothetical protein PKA98_21240, partial [Acidimicrobiales bacterium]|nr:hypothetical protein [Acidimicrobiales bacterium]
PPRPRATRRITAGPFAGRSTAVAATLVAVLLAALVAACGSDPEPPPVATGDTESTATTAAAAAPDGDEVGATPVALPEAASTVEIVGTEYVFELDATAADGAPIDLDAGEALPAGWTHVEFHNEGDEAHQVMFARLKDGVDLAELADTAGDDSSGSAAIEFVDMLGGVSYIGPGQSIEALVDLPAGMVLAMCYVPDAHGVAHALMGMTTTLTVEEAAAGADTGSPADAEPVVGTIEMTADGYQVPDEVPPGWYRVVNLDEGEAGSAGTGLHELAVLGLDEPLAGDELDQLLDDLATNATPAVDLVAVGGMGALSAGFEGYLYLDLESGPYLAVDFMPDPGEPRPHLLDGYVTAFEA